ncbi:MAG: hypothetical protein OXU79_08195 [Gemmatimonadota bacterium]|nr:hypothetical protein [Gemmatimonadota bacterium]
MSDHVVQEDRFTDGAAFTSLNEDFRRVVERIQTELNGHALPVLDAERLAGIDAAERTVDSLALAFRRGAGDQDAWHGALVIYESTWLETIRGARDSEAIKKIY